MNINKFAKQVTLSEGMKESVSIAQVKEILRIVNKMTYGILYLVIKVGIIKVNKNV